jgi:tRNA 2-thiouridine synthesizing protein A
MADFELDVKRLLCPMPVIKTQKKVKDLSPGDVLTITATDPGALHDVPAWARMYGHKILKTDNVDLDIIIQLEVGAL